jgi:hypothetical protein
MDGRQDGWPSTPQTGEVRLAIMGRQIEYLEENHNKLEQRLKEVEEELRTEREIRKVLMARYGGMAALVMVFGGFVGWMTSQWNAWFGGILHK